MLTPSKYSHPDRTVISVALVMLSRLRRRRVESYDSLRGFLTKYTKGCDPLFLPSLHFLFVVGLVDYRPQTDSFEYTGS